NQMLGTQKAEARLAFYKMLRGERLTPADLSHLIVGKDTLVELTDGRVVRFRDFDYTATKPVFLPVLRAMEDFLRAKHNTHRGAGQKSMYATEMKEAARAMALRFCGANPAQFGAAAVANTTDGVNKLARQLKEYLSDGIILVSAISHHSTQLPFRALYGNDRVKLIEINADGSLDLNHLRYLLKEHEGRVRLVCVESVSNVTGFINPLDRIIEMTAGSGAKLFVDHAQGAASMPIRMDDGIDFLAFSGHKLYATGGTGFLVGLKDMLNPRPGDYVPPVIGGGTVRGVTREIISWDFFPHNLEGGSPNPEGEVALATAMKLLLEADLSEIANIENIKAAHTLTALKKELGEQIEILGENDGFLLPRMGVITFNLYSEDGKKIPSISVGNILARAFGIGIRTGCFCAGPYMQSLLGMSEEKARRFVKQDGSCDATPHANRVSFSFTTSDEDLAYLISALKQTARDDLRERFLASNTSPSIRNFAELNNLPWI
ncbi:MAG: aminotransferase class V-fold PLP-dependent enzyme, partial [Candidatus Margulisiibacteriota bacterium]